jgi:hypothetical protein
MHIAPHSPEDVLRGNVPQYHSYTVIFIASTYLVKFRPICDLCSDASGWKTSTLLLDSIWCDKLFHSWYELATNVILQSSPKKSWCIQSSKLIAQFFWPYPHCFFTVPLFTTSNIQCWLFQVPTHKYEKWIVLNLNIISWANRYGWRIKNSHFHIQASWMHCIKHIFKNQKNRVSHCIWEL